MEPPSTVKGPLQNATVNEYDVRSSRHIADGGKLKPTRRVASLGREQPPPRVLLPPPYLRLGLLILTFDYRLYPPTPNSVPAAPDRVRSLVFGAPPFDRWPSGSYHSINTPEAGVVPFADPYRAFRCPSPNRPHRPPNR